MCPLVKYIRYICDIQKNYIRYIYDIQKKCIRYVYDNQKKYIRYIYDIQKKELAGKAIKPERYLNRNLLYSKEGSVFENFFLILKT